MTGSIEAAMQKFHILMSFFVCIMTAFIVIASAPYLTDYKVRIAYANPSISNSSTWLDGPNNEHGPWVSRNRRFLRDRAQTGFDETATATATAPVATLAVPSA